MVLMMVIEIDKLTMHHLSPEVLVDVFIKWSDIKIKKTVGISNSFIKMALSS